MLVQKKIKRVEIEETEESSFFSTFLKSLKDIIVNNLLGNLKENFTEKVKKIEKIVFRKVVAFLFLFLGIIFLSLAVIFFCRDYLQLSFSIGFLILGVLFGLLSLIFKILAKNN